MFKRERPFVLALGVILFIFTSYAMVVEKWHAPDCIPLYWNETFIFNGFATFPNPTTREFPPENVSAKYERTFRTVLDPERPDLVLEDVARLGDKAITRVTWNEGDIDRHSGQHLQAKYKGDIYRFPRDVKRQTYRLRYSYLKGIPVSFEREEAIDGLTTYLFSYKGRGEWTELYSGTEDFPAVPVPPGHEIKCSDDQFSYKVWVEPRTGKLIQIEEGCPTGDAIYNIATGEKVASVVRWGGKTTEETVRKQVLLVKRELRQ